MSAKLTSTKAQVRDPQRVGEVLDSYELLGVEINLQEEAEVWFLTMQYDDSDLDGLEPPQAVHSDHWTSADANPDEADDYGIIVLDHLFKLQGTDGFLSLLRALIPCLITPLMILQADSLKISSTAQVWSIQPGGKDVQVLNLSFR
jgi:hypothetical protein